MSANPKGDQTFPATGTPATIAPSGGVIRGVPNGIDPPKRIPVISVKLEAHTFPYHRVEIW